jgi:hypothetical protein
MVILWSKLRDHVGYLEHVDRIDSGISIQVHRSAARHFPRLGRPGRDLDCGRQKLFADVVDDRGFRVPSAAWLYLYRASQGRREARRCRRAMVIAGKSKAPVDVSRTSDVTALRFPLLLCTPNGNCAATRRFPEGAARAGPVYAEPGPEYEKRQSGGIIATKLGS